MKIRNIMQGSSAKGKKAARTAMAVMMSVMLMFTATACGSSESDSKDANSTEYDQDLMGDYTVDDLFTDRDLETSYDESEAVNVTLSDSGSEADGEGVEIDGSDITITQEGIYVLSGTLSDGQVTVAATDDAKVQIVLDGVDITSSSATAIFAQSADKVFVTAAEGTENSLSGTGEAETSSDDKNLDGVIFSECDLTVNGTGSLDIDSASCSGIVGKDDLRLTDITMTINAGVNGLEANDSIRVASGEYTITAAEDGVHADNDDEIQKGYFYMFDGTFTIDAGDDGVHSSSYLTVNGGSITVTESYEGLEGAVLTINDGDIDVTSSDDGFNASNGGGGDMFMGGGFGDRDGDKGEGMIEHALSDIDGITENEDGSISITEAAAEAIIERAEQFGATTDATASDVEACTSYSDLLDLFTFDMSQMHQGHGQDGQMPGASADGSTDSTDGSMPTPPDMSGAPTDQGGAEGTNGAAPADGSAGSTDGSMPTPPDMSGASADQGTADTADSTSAEPASDTSADEDMSADEETKDTMDPLLTINGGNIHVSADGDGLDSNGNMIINGGATYVAGPTNNGNTAVDYGDGCTAVMNGGILIATGSSGMAENFDDSSTQGVILQTLDDFTTGAVVLKDSEGNELASWTPDKKYNCILISAPGIEDGSTYTLTSGDGADSDEITMDGIIYGTIGGFGGGFGGGPNGDHSGFPGMSGSDSSDASADGSRQAASDSTSANQ